MRKLSRPAALLASGLLTGCQRQFSAMNPAGPQAGRIAGLGWLMIGLGTAVYLLVIGFLLYALWRGRRRAESAVGPTVDRRITRWVVGAVAVTFVIEAFLLVHSFWTGRQLADFADPDALTIRVTGHQWWWQVEYEDPVAARRVQTANEIHIPVGRRVKLELVSADVIHSFWVPNLQGKTDLIPGYSTSTYLQADSAGVYHGRCAEFCGLQHAHMDFLVIAEPPARFAAWYTGQLRDAAPPASPEEAKGKQVFLASRCAICHRVRGTEAGGTLGPELTHLASRLTLGAVTLANTRGHLGGWVLDPQKIKPGVKMPPNQLGPDELRALLTYLESLK